MINRNLLNLLVCPVTKNKVFYHKEKNELISLDAGLAYPVVDDIPVMIESKARKIDDDEYEALKNKFKSEIKR